MCNSCDRPLFFGLLGLGLCLLLAVSCGSTGSSTALAPSNDTPIWQLLQRNPVGYVVMMRHAEAPGVGDPSPFRLDDCSTQRNLSPEGRAQAQRIGQGFRQRKISIAQVFSSQWCRCLETARLLQLGQVQPLPALNSFFQSRRTEPQQSAAVRQLIIKHRHTPGVLLLITHQVNITAISGTVPPSGGSVVLKANDRGAIDVIGQLPPE
ncbi:MAG: histidine phosphatase family protein [Leptolyngbyaceae cyanobacterium bins.302]|nr:histidine phosphatase family protein [Leptolyngbyaceae cyanobacterium bins.302]